MPYYVLTLGLNIPDTENIENHVEALEGMGYSVDLEHVDDED